MSTAQPYRNRVDATLASFFTSSVAQAQSISPSYGRLWEAMERLVMAGGKRLRPHMTLLAYEAFGGKDVDAMVPVATAHELLHAALLIHDDIIDRDDIRYGIKNINGQYKALYAQQPEPHRTHYAYSAALLGGDLLLSGAYSLINQSAVTNNDKHYATALLSESLFAVAGGELLDTEAALLPFDQTDATLIATHKTASYSFVKPLVTGATLAGASNQAQQQLRDLGLALGIAFQFTDDILGTFGEEDATGKSVTSDIREGKHTFLIEQYLTMSEPDERALHDTTFGNPDAPLADIEALKSAIEASGARAYVEGVIDDYGDKARAILARLGFSQQHQTAFEQLIVSTTRRSF